MIYIQFILIYYIYNILKPSLLNISILRVLSIKLLYLYLSIGNPDISATLMDCILHIADPMLCPSFISNSGTKNLYVAFSFNNLMDVSELEGTVTMDFYFRLYWTDERLNFPSLWDAIQYNTSNSFLVDTGIDITELIRANEDNLRMWLPDTHFVDGKDIQYLSETITIRPYGVMFWSRHTVATLQQPGFCKFKYFRIFILF